MKKIVDGNKACSDVAYLFSELAAIYPITPASPMASNFDDIKNIKKNLFNDSVDIVEMQSEAGAAGAVHGALITGTLATTFTASQGLLLMLPNMYKIAGEGLPGVIHVAARSIATHALSIFGDHSDIYAVRQSGFAMLASTNVYDAQNLAAVAHLSAIDGSVPFLHFFDGFRTSHEINTIKSIDEIELLKLINFDKVKEFKNKALNVGCNYQMGLAENEDIYFQSVEARNNDYNALIDIVNDNMQKINALMGTDYKPFNYYGSKTAKNVIVAMGSVCDTIKMLIDYLKDDDIGLVEVHLYRPFSANYLKEVLPKSTKNIAVLDRTKEAGSIGEPLYLDVLSALKNMDVNIVGGRYGLASKNTTPADILSVYKMLKGKLQDNFTIGIVDDVTNLSLSKENLDIKVSDKEILIYGFGSDGMVSASKEMMHLIGDNTNNFVQGYFQYDSKKSGGVTVSNLRINSKEIKAPFYVTNPSFIVVTKDEYLKEFDILSGILNEGVVLVNTSKRGKELDNLFNNEAKQLIKEKKIKVLLIDASSIALKCGIKGKISKIMEVVILKLINFGNMVAMVESEVKKKFATKGDSIVEANLKAISMALKSVELVSGDFSILSEPEVKFSVIDKINHRLGDTLTVGELIDFKNGRFPGGLSLTEKRKISELVPKWNKDNCITCAQCSIVCPHGVIRPFISQDKTKGIPLLGKNEYNYEVLISEEDCTSCGLCINICPGKKGLKALEWGKATYDNSNYVKEMFNNYQNEEIIDQYTIKGSQLIKPKFCFSGACAGCGETPYIKLLTQLFGDAMVIANATGCSSIYGGSAPSTPYTIPWANSLFEDNAEFGYGMYLSYKKQQKRIVDIINSSMEAVDIEVKELYKKYLENLDNYEITKEVSDELIAKKIPNDLRDLINYMPKRSVFIIGGDGWAYDIGYGGIDHVLHSGENVNIIVLDTEVYSNTGGQTSKATRLGAVAEFANQGKRTCKKDLFKIAMDIPNVYVGNVALGYNFMQTIKVFKEAELHKGPSIVICYCPCIEQGIKTGMGTSSQVEKLAVECGYLTLMHYNPIEKKLYIDSREPDFSKYKEFLSNEVRYSSLMLKDEKLALELLDAQIEEAREKYKKYVEEASK